MGSFDQNYSLLRAPRCGRSSGGVVRLLSIEFSLKDDCYGIRSSVTTYICVFIILFKQKHVIA